MGSSLWTDSRSQPLSDRARLGPASAPRRSSPRSGLRGCTVGRAGVAGRDGRWGVTRAVLPCTPPGGGIPSDDRAAVESRAALPHSSGGSGLYVLSTRVLGCGVALVGFVSITAAPSCLHRWSGVRSKASGRPSCGGDSPPPDRGSLESFRPRQRPASCRHRPGAGRAGRCGAWRTAPHRYSSRGRPR